MERRQNNVESHDGAKHLSRYYYIQSVGGCTLQGEGMTKEAEGILEIMILRHEKPDIFNHNALMDDYCS